MRRRWCGNGFFPGVVEGFGRRTSRLSRGKLLAWFLSGGLVLGLGCEEPSGPDQSVPPLTYSRTDSAGVAHLSLSHTLAEIAGGETEATLLQPDLRVGDLSGPEETWFGAIADIASMGGGGFAVLDHMESRVLLIDSTGGLSSTLGREGEGPGEFQQPWALTRVGEAIVVRQNTANSTFTVFDGHGSVRGTAPAEPDGDWTRPRFRQPRSDLLGFQMGPEDVTRRLQPFGSESFIHLLQVNETAEWDFADPLEFESIPTFLVKYDLDGLVQDTLAELPGPPTYVQSMWPGQTFFYTQPLYSSAPVWTTGDGWYAIGHGDSTDVVVRDMTGDVLLRVRFPNRRRPVSESDKLIGANWFIAGALLSYPVAMDRYLAEPFAFKKQQGVFLNDPENGIHFADSIPMVTAAFGAGRCLFLSGYRPADWLDGTSLTWLVIDVANGTVKETIRLRPPPEGTLPGEGKTKAFTQYGAAVREIDEAFAFTFLRMPDGVPVVERFPTSLDCGN